MKGRNPSVGRHAIGSPIARSGIKPPSRTGSASGSGVGTGKNQQTGANTEYGSSGSKLNDNNQLAQWLDQAPEPFRNAQPSQNPQKYQTGPSSKVGGIGGKTGAAGVASGSLAGSAGIGSRPTSNFGAAAAGPKGGLGQENGKVVGKSQPRRVGNVFNQPKAKFYGR